MSVKKNVVYNVILTVSNIIFPIITFPYAARVLGPAGMGEVDFALNFCRYFVVVAALGVTVYGVREIAKVKGNKFEISKRFFELSIIRVICTILTLVPYFIVVLTGNKFQSNLPLYYWGAFYILVNITSFEWFFAGIENFQYITVRSILSKAISLLLLFFFVKTRNDVIPYFLVNVLTFVISGFYNLKYISKFISLKDIKLAALDYVVHLKPLLYIFGGILAVNVYALLDSIILGFLQGNRAVGFYGVATKITRISLTIITSLSVVLVPRLSYALSQNRHEEVSKLLDRSFTFVYTLSIPMAVAIFALAPELILTFSGHEFGPAVTTLRILSPVIIIVGLTSIFSTQILTPLAKDKYVMATAMIGAVISVSVNFLLVPLLKQNGSALTNVLSELTVTVLCFYFAKKFLAFRVNAKEGFINFLGTLPYFLITYIMRLYVHNKILIIAFTGLLAFLVFLVFNILIVRNVLVIDLINKYPAFKFLKKRDKDPVAL